MRLLYATLIFLLLCERSNSQNPLWVKLDEVVIKNFIKSYKDDSLKISTFFKPKFNDTTQLGLNYYIVESQMPVGYIHIRGTFYYFKDSLVGYKLNPDMPDEQNLKEKYRKWYSEIFVFSDTSTLIPKVCAYSQWIQPLSQYDGRLKVEEQSELFKLYFSTESGNIFGCNNGWGGYHLNCQTYIKLLPELTAEKVYLLMYSKNPITRLTAFFFYFTNKNKFSNQTDIERWIEYILSDSPPIRSAYFDLIYMKSAKEVLEESIKSNNK